MGDNITKQIAVKDKLYDQIKELKIEGRSWSDALQELIQSNNLQEATITPEGQISKDLAGKTILYRIKDITLTPN